MKLDVDNYAPTCDSIRIDVGVWVINIDRHEDGQVTVEIWDDEDGSETRYVLGQEGFTQKL